MAQFHKYAALFGFPLTHLKPEEVATQVSYFLGWLVLKELAFGTIKVYLYAITAYYKDLSLGTFDVSKSFVVLRCLRGARNILGHLPQPKLAFLPEFFRFIKDGMRDNSYVDTRDYAAMSLGFFGLLRKAELLALTWKDVHTIEGGVKLWVRVSKTDKDKKGVWVHLASREDELCPRKAILHLVLVTPKELLHRDQHIFASTKKEAVQSKALTPSAFVARLKVWIEFIGLDPTDYSGHSLRRGGATALLKAGVAPHLVQLQGRWVSDCWKLYAQHSHATLIAITAAISGSF